MKMAMRNIISSTVLLVLAVGYAWQIMLLPTRDTMPNTPGPAFFPWLIVSCVALLSVALLLRGIRELKADQAGNSHSMAGKIATNGHKPFAMMLIYAIYLAALTQLGFVISSVVFFAVLMWLYGSRNFVLIALCSLLLPITLYLIFTYGFQILLPRNGWGF